MKFTPEVVAALQTLKNAAETDFELHRVNVLERDLTAPPVVEIIDDAHQKFDGIVYRIKKSDKHFHSTGSKLHRVVWRYYHGEIPNDYIVHHIDHNPKNNAIENLLIMTRKDHQSLHGKSKNALFAGRNLKQNEKAKYIVPEIVPHKIVKSIKKKFALYVAKFLIMVNTRSNKLALTPAVLNLCGKTKKIRV